MPKIHFICGPVGAGKTTYAIKLAEDIGAIRFSLDDWMRDLFFADKPEPINYQWAIERVVRCEVRILAMSKEILDAGKDVIWDLGLMETDQRKRLIGQARDTGYQIRTHLLDASPETRLARIELRNQEKPEGFAFEVTREMFDFMEPRFVTPTQEEMGEMITVSS